MKKIFLTVFALASTLAFVGCSEDFDTINTNPTAPINVNTPGLFNNANKQLTDATRGDFSSGRMTLPWVQYSAQRNYTSEDRFQFRQETNTALYTDLYTTAQNYKTIIELCTNPATAATMANYGDIDNQIAAARIMLSLTFLHLVDAYGDIPYYSYGNSDPDFQALQLQSSGNLTPKFASQTKIYTDLLKELKEASEMINDGELIFTEGDHIFGSTEKMKRFANSLRLRIANRVKGVIPTATDHITDAIASGVMLSNDDTVGLAYQNDDVFPSPMYKSFFVDNRTDFAVANTFIDLLTGELGVFGVDPRLQKYAAPNTASKATIQNQSYAETDDLTKYKGMPYGIPDGLTPSQRTGACLFSYNVLKRNYTEVLMEYAEVEFLLSEVNGWDDAHYKNGVTASMERWNVDPAKITAFVAALPAASQANVLNQKYVALYMQPYEAWSEYRRTGFPNTILLPGETYELNNPTTDTPPQTTYVFTPIPTVTEMPTRFTYPNTLSTLNGANYQAASQAIGGDLITTKLIWDLN
ncbi:SusD/RagB family nutrient-binding outer membrane lipoprotein [Flavobacterium kingsejongi]|uniref:SusD/RagB family nutrient-binding outer membrane lipoprotein n=1 Tax=Flavobacterium kingsejongi TaxID=1678728 RepID=A0A2S1LNU7_9FLAO|nr:SusD/RagB family nutrient-binding outer membrane lipoprotein [Flavobacterium kingsejongi]AWG25306.1 hypothetical protein FK004_08680 [Flavobacterium kingsejongi]